MNRLLRLVCILVLSNGMGHAQAAPATGELAVARWEASVLSRGVQGAVAVLAGDEGMWRLEIATAPDTSLAAMLSRNGRGWTVIATSDGEGTRNSWGREWRDLEPDLARVLAVATDAALAGGAGGRVVVEGATVDLRSRLAHRGTGRGGDGEVLRLQPDLAGGTRMTSSRRPGILRLSAWRRHRVDFPARESFTPLWPLSELLDFATENGNPED